MCHFLKAMILFLLLPGITAPAWSQDADTPAAPPPQEEPTGAPTSGGFDEELEPLPDVESAIFLPRYSGPSDYVVAFQTVDVRKVEKAFEATAVGRLLEEEPELKELSDKIKERYEKKMTLLKELHGLAEELGEEKKFDAVISQWLEDINELGPDLVSSNVFIYLNENEEGEKEPSFLFAAVIAENALDLVTKKIDEIVKILEEDEKTKEALPSISHNGKDVFAYTFEGGQFNDVWFVLDERDIYCGINDLSLAERLVKGPPEQLCCGMERITGQGVPVAVCDVPVSYLVDLAMEDLTDEERADTDGVLEILGISEIQSLIAGVSLEGPHIRETFFLHMPEEPKGLFSLLRPLKHDGAGAPPFFPRIEPNLMTVRASIDVEAMIALGQDLAKEIEDDDSAEGGESDSGSLEEGLLKMVVEEGAKALDGGFVFSLSSPKPGGMVPRFAAAFGIGEQEKFDNLLSLVKKALTGIIFEESEFKEVTFTTVKIPNNPMPLVPSFMQYDNVLYIAETPWTLKSIIGTLEEKKAGAAGGPDNGEGAADVAALPLALPFESDELILETDFDAREIFRLVYDLYMPVAQVAFSAAINQEGGKREQLLDLAELPLSDTVLDHLSAGRAGAAFGPDGFYMSAASPLGDPIVAATVAISVPFGVAAFGRGVDEELGGAERTVCKLRAGKIGEALKVFRQSFGGGKRFPHSLGELVSRGLIEDLDTFIVPSDKNPASIEYETEDGEVEEFDVSYKYLPGSKFDVPCRQLKDGVDFGFGGNFEYDFEQIILEARHEAGSGKKKPDDTKTVILYETNRNAHQGRILVCSDGSVYHVSEKNFKKIIALK